LALLLLLLLPLPLLLVLQAEVSGFSEKSTHSVHLANAILCVDLHPSKANLALTGAAPLLTARP
jgi:hypothetical protein